MSGRHEPPSKRSFYFSLATSTLRAVIVIALIVGGIVVINQAFPGTSSGGGSVPDGGGLVTGPSGPTGESGATGATGGTGDGNGGDGGQQEEPLLVGMNVAVRNGTGVSGLASDTAAKLEEDYQVNAIQIDDAPSTVSVTTIYYRSNGSQDEAELLAKQFFKKIDPEITKLQGGGGVDKDVEIAIYIGTDYAATKA
jgi:hypothetical protein